MDSRRGGVVNKSLESVNALDNEELRAQFEAQYEQQRPDLTSELKTELGISADNQMRGMLFSLLMFNTLNLQEQTYLFEQYQKDNLIIYPETIIFSMIKLVPINLVKERIKGMDLSE